MANEINYRDPFGTTGLNVYFQRLIPTGLVWNGTSHVAFNATNWATYKIARNATQEGGGDYWADMPAAAAGLYTIRAFLQAAGAAASTDQFLGAGPIQWNGTAEIALGSAVVLPTTPPAGYGGAPLIHSGTARGGTTNTIQLALAASSVDNTYQNALIWLDGGTGASQSACIIYGGYVGLTRTVTISTNWATVPDATTTYQILPQGAMILGQIGGTARTVTQDHNGTESLTVVAQGSQLPIAGATVTAYLASEFSSQGTGAPVIDSATTDSLGHWTLTLSPSAYVLVISFAGEANEVTIIVS